jgi:hypothetical protein
MANSSVPITSGTGTNVDSFTTPNGDHRQVVIIGTKGAHAGHAATFVMKGRAAAAARHLAAIHNATGSTIVAEVRRVTINAHIATAAAAGTLGMPVRLWKVTALPTSGTALTKVADDSSATATSASITLFQDASADFTNSATALAATLPAGTVVEEILLNANTVGSATSVFLDDPTNNVILRPLEGLVVTMTGTVAGDLATNSYTVSIFWEEYTP